MTLSKRILCGLALAALVTVPVYATLVAQRVRTIAVTGSGTFAMPLNDAGALTAAFSGSGRFLISYSAECSSSTTGWVSIQIKVDGVAVLPTGGTDDAFCTDYDNDGSLDGWVTAHYRVFTPSLGSGVHTAAVDVTTVGAGSARLDDAVLTIEK
jgi:hypothetical protein